MLNTPLIRKINPDKNNYCLDENLNNSFISGNKLRKLQGILREVKNVKGILSFGSPFSSHLLACAYYGRKMGIPVTGIVITDQDANVLKYPHLNMAEKFGARLIFTPNDCAYEVIEKYKNELSDYLWIPGGGHTLEAAKAYEFFFEELFKNETIWNQTDKIILPYGTGTTTYGIWKATRKHKKEIQVIGISVSRSKEKCIAAIEELEGLQEFPNLLIVDQFAGKYGHIDKETERYRWKFFEETGLLPDPVYNARAVHYLYGLNLNNALLVNTGGMLNNLL